MWEENQATLSNILLECQYAVNASESALTWWDTHKATFLHLYLIVLFLICVNFSTRDLKRVFCVFNHFSITCTLSIWNLLVETISLKCEL